MSITRLNTRIILRNDTLENWNKNPDVVLEKGEVAFVGLPQVVDGVANYENPVYMVKVGNGKNKLAELQWLEANAGDVFPWAKQEVLPVTIENSGEVITQIRWDDATKGVKVLKNGKIVAKIPGPGEESNYTPTGKITMPKLEVSQNVTTQELNMVSDVGSPIKFKDNGKVEKLVDTKLSFATKAMLAQVGQASNLEYDNDGVDDETIVLFPAEQKEAVSTVGAINYTPPTLQGAIPTFTKQSIVTAVDMPSVAYAQNKVDLEGVPVKITIEEPKTV